MAAVTSDSVMQTANFDNRRSSRTWKITAHFSPSIHVPIYDSTLQYSQQYLRDYLNSRLQHMQKTENNMHSITLLSFAYPRQFRSHAEVPVIVIMHFSQLVSFPTIHAFLGRGTTGVTATCTPVDFGAEKTCPDVTLHPIFATFRDMSSKHKGPAVEPNFYIRVDVVGDSDAPQATIAAQELMFRSWTFNAAFDPSFHPVLVTDCDKVAADYIQDMLNMDVVNGLLFFSFAMPSKRSELGSHGAVSVTGVLNSPATLRMRRVRSIFPADLPVLWTPIQPGRGISFTSCPLYTEYVRNPNALIRVDVRGGSDDVLPKKTGPKGPRKPMEPLDANLTASSGIFPKES